MKHTQPKLCVLRIKENGKKSFKTNIYKVIELNSKRDVTTFVLQAFYKRAQYNTIHLG